MGALIVTAPNEIPESGSHLRKVFLAGSITDAPDWQADAIEALKDLDVVLLNPRRANFPMDDPTAAEAQITWEHEMLREADAILFWFSKDSLGPIVLYELGCWTVYQQNEGVKPLFIGVEAGYKRSQDVVIQTRLVRGADEPVWSTLDDTLEACKDWVTANPHETEPAL